MAAAAEAEAGGLEVRLLRRLPAQPARLRGRAARRSPARSRSPTSSRRRAATVEGPYDLSLVEGSITTAARRRADPGGPAARRRRLVTIGACATAGGIQALRNFADVERVHLGRLRPARLHLDAGDLDADLRARAGRLRAARLPDQQAPAARGDQRVPARAPAARSPRTASASSASGAGNVCVMVAHGTPCLGPVTHAGCGALCPAYNRGCYGCFGPMETPNTASLARLAAAARRRSAGPSTARLPHASTPSAEPFREREASAMSEADATNRPSRSTPWRASRARARCTCGCADGAGDGRPAADLRAAALLRGVPARPRAARRPRTSPRASAASARSPTR